MGCWPPEVLGRVLFHPLPIPSVDDAIEYGSSTYKRNLVRKDHAAAFSVCKAFGKALLTVCRRFSAKLGGYEYMKHTPSINAVTQAVLPA